MKFKEISIYPTIKKDIAIILDKDITADEISKVIKKAGGNLLVNYEIFDVYTNAILGDKKWITEELNALRIISRSTQHTNRFNNGIVNCSALRGSLENKILLNFRH